MVKEDQDQVNLDYQKKKHKNYQKQEKLNDKDTSKLFMLTEYLKVIELFIKHLTESFNKKR